MDKLRLDRETGMNSLNNTSLKPYNTFGIDQHASEIWEIHTDADVQQMVTKLGQKKLLILGGGSNILLTRDFDGVVVLNRLKGLHGKPLEDQRVLVSARAGENWHQFVLWTLENNWYGLENLSLIPGCVGAAPMQNIGAYGVEIKDLFHSLDAVHLQTGEHRTFSREECQFGYRESIFKRELAGQYLITDVRFILSKQAQVHTAYGAIADELRHMGIENPSPSDVSNAVIAIRSSKLPNPAEIGNAGSFFKNPVVEMALVQKLQANYPSLPVYPVDENHAKVAAGWLIEQAGWKGFEKEGRYGVHKKQALVLVHYRNATGIEIWKLSEDIIRDVEHKFGIALEREVNIL